MGAHRPIGVGGDLFQIALQLHQAVQLLQAQRSGGGAVFGTGPEPVPAPEIALMADEALTGEEVRLQVSPLRCVRDNADLPQPPRQNRRTADMGA